MNVLLVGGGGREHAIAAALCRRPDVKLFAVMKDDSPGVGRMTTGKLIHPEGDSQEVVHWAKKKGVGLAVVGFEDPLARGLCDELESAGIPCLGPKKEAARLEGSKLFMRELMLRHRLPGRVEFAAFHDVSSLRAYLIGSKNQFAIKPIGLTSGKGVRVMGDQLKSVDEAIAYGTEVIERGMGGAAGVLAEELLVGEEFTLQCFVDGVTVIPMPAVRDYKRAFDGDRGPNTGGMGSYSQADGLLPFLSSAQRDKAADIMREVVAALRSEGTVYKGVLYGQFMVTSAGLKLIEFNVRFGDPEAMNVLSVLETDLVDICEAIIAGRLDRIQVTFRPKATVCKYVAPPGYPSAPRAGSPLWIDEAAIQRLGARVFYAKVTEAPPSQSPHEDRERDGGAFPVRGGSDRTGQSMPLRTATSRSLAVLGLGDTVAEAEDAAEQALGHIKGAVMVRHDIGRPGALTSQGLRKP